MAGFLKKADKAGRILLRRAERLERGNPSRESAGQRLASRISAFLLACALLTGCGTNVRWLLAEDARLTIEADRTTTAAEPLASGIEEPVYDAEYSKIEACRFLQDAVVQRMQKRPTFGEQFLSDLLAVAVLLVPVDTVERCSDSVRLFRKSIAQLRRKLIELGVPIPNAFCRPGESRFRC